MRCSLRGRLSFRRTIRGASCLICNYSAMGVAIRGDLMRKREGGITFQVSVACIRWVIIDELNDKVELLVSY